MRQIYLLLVTTNLTIAIGLSAITYNLLEIRNTLQNRPIEFTLPQRNP